MVDVPHDITFAHRVAKARKHKYNGWICPRCSKIIPISEKDPHIALCSVKYKRPGRRKSRYAGVLPAMAKVVGELAGNSAENITIYVHSRKGAKRAAPIFTPKASQVVSMPKGIAKCPICENMMPQASLEKHMRRKHGGGGSIR